MADAVDEALAELLLGKVTGLGAGATSARISFQPPRSNLATTAFSNEKGLDIYLVDLRENRRLRSNERRPTSTNGSVAEQPVPMRLDRHYLISAWSPDTDPSTRTQSEHELLSEVIAVLASTPLVVPSLAEEPLPVTVVPPDGFPKLAEFWGTMPGPERPWKPVVYLIVTVPVVLDSVYAGRAVTTLSATYNANVDGETLINLGGLVRKNGEPVPGAWVQLLAATGPHVQQVETDEEGRFRFHRLVAGTYVFRAGAVGVGFDQQTIDVPSLTGEYNLRLT